MIFAASLFPDLWRRKGTVELKKCTVAINMATNV